ncbi:MAG: DNA polymerase I [Oscillospiraceae bacterium]|jgi:DNA polymerase-1|nr:DNA polymerase I [Oscillospiraceae bacterium]
MKLLILDGNSILNRAFYGIKLLTTRDGRFTNGIYGFLTIYLSLREQAKPEGVAVAFDVKAPTFRHAMYDQYKAGRHGMPEELAQQLPVLKELLEALGLKVLEAPGWEADDILGTLAARCAAQGHECVLATGDRDSLQLVTDEVQVWLAATKAGKPETRKYTPEAILAEYGVTPAQLIEVKGLQGDSSDHIPGVAGIGPKTAQALVARFGTMEEIYSHLDDPLIKQGVRAKLLQDKEQAFLSRELGTIRTDVPLEWEQYRPAPPNAAKVTRMMAELEMFGLLERLQLPAEPAPAQQKEAPRRECAEEFDFDALLERLRAAGKAYFVPKFDGELLEGLLFAEQTQDTLAACGHLSFGGFLQALLEDEAIAKYTCDTKLLWRYCLRGGIKAKNIAMDTSLAGYLRNPGASGYDPQRLARDYHCADFAQLCALLERELRENGQFALLQDIELPLARVLAAMELAGVAVDRERIARFGALLDQRIDALTEEITELAGETFNINSPKQLGVLLFQKLQLRAPKKNKTGYSTNAETLEALRGEHPIIAPILEYRKLMKLKSTYCEGLLKVAGADGRIHSSLNQTETRTGRISSSEPNLQNIPVRTELGRELRLCFVAREGWTLVDADYSQIELRVLAAMAEEETMIKAFREGADIHTITASQVFGLPPQLVTPLMRTRAKAINFGIIYGIGPFSLGKDMGVPFREAQNYIESYFSTYPKIRQFRADLIEQAKERGYAETLFGRRRPLPELASSNRQLREFGERVAVNMPVQGTAADVIKIAMVRVYQRLLREGRQARLILQVHDELIVEAPPDEAEAVAQLLREEMEAAAALRVPLETQVHCGGNWDEAH